MRILTAARLLLTSPGSFVQRLKYLLHQKQTLSRLKRLADGAGQLPALADYGSAKWPFFNDDDAQEAAYHVHFHEWHDGLKAMFAAHIPPGAVVIDIGANLGFTTLVFAQLAGPGGAVHSFEPGRRMADKLEAMAAANRLHNVRLHRLALGEKRAQLQLNIPASSGNASLRKGDDAGEKQMVAVERLDDCLGNQLSSLDFVKIDTEGFEIDVLRGAEQTLRRFKPVIYIELARDFYESSAASVAFLKSLGYHFPVEPDLETARNGDNFLVLPDRS